MKKFRPLIFYIILFLFILAYSSMTDGYDYDLWARLIAGMGFLQSGHVLKQDFLSYTPTHIWYDHEWGSGVVFYIIQHYLGPVGIIFAQSILVFLIFYLITKIINLRGLKTTSAYNFLFYFFVFHSIGININSPIRCQMFSYLFFALFIYILEKARQNDNKWLATIPFIMIIWNNLHGGCVSGIGLIGIYIIGEFLNKAPVKKYVLTLIPTILVLPLNPWGFDYIKFLIHATTMPRPYIMEWWGMFSTYYLKKLIITKGFILLLLLSELSKTIKNFSFQKMDKTKFIILATTLYLSIQHIKMTPFFIIAASSFIYDDFYIFINKIETKIKSLLKIKPELFQTWFESAKEFAIYCIILVFAIINIRAKTFSPIVTTKKYPLREVEFIKLNKIKGNILCNFGLGSYVSYKLYPQNKIFMDGRYEEVYDDGLILMIKSFMLQEKGSDIIFEKYPPNIIIVEKFYPAYASLKQRKNWNLAYESELFAVFVDNKSKKDSYKQPPNFIKYYKNTHFETNIKFEKSS